jgi:hypothetical protein
MELGCKKCDGCGEFRAEVGQDDDGYPVDLELYMDPEDRPGFEQWDETGAEDLRPTGEPPDFHCRAT